jgi:monoterpene epsilon-lactone hydrolase
MHDLCRRPPVAINLILISAFLTAVSIPCAAQVSSSNPDSSTFESDGTVHMKRVVPVPATVSPQAQQWLKEIERGPAQAKDLAQQRTNTNAWRKRDSDVAREKFPVKLTETSLAGVRVHIIEPLQSPEANRNKVLINLHGGGFVTDSGSLIEGIPIANLAKMKVVSVYYRLAPENPFPVAVEDIVAVYKELLKTYNPKNVAIFGTSAGAILTAEVTVRLQQLKLPLPAALGVFSGLADFSRTSDSQQLFGLSGLSGNISPQDPNGTHDRYYVGKTDPRDPVLSPLFADLHGFPPTLLVTSTRDLLLSSTSIFHLALLHAGVDAQLVVFEALPHAFWYHFQLPETQQALELMAHFFDEKLSH